MSEENTDLKPPARVHYSRRGVWPHSQLSASHEASARLRLMPLGSMKWGQWGPSHPTINPWSLPPAQPYDHIFFGNPMIKSPKTPKHTVWLWHVQHPYSSFWCDENGLNIESAQKIEDCSRQQPWWGSNLRPCWLISSCSSKHWPWRKKSWERLDRSWATTGMVSQCSITMDGSFNTYRHWACASTQWWCVFSKLKIQFHIVVYWTVVVGKFSAP